MGIIRTSCPPAAHGAVARAVCVAADVAHTGIQQALVRKSLAIHVLNAPEAACGDGGALCAGGNVHWGCGSGVHGEWAEEAGDEGHGEVGKHDQKKGAEELQLGW